MAKWIDVGAADELPDGEKICTQVENLPVAVFHVDGQLHAIKNSCPHAGLPLGQGEFRGHVITCPYHGYAYRVDTGQNIDFPNQEPDLPRLPVRVQAGRIEVDIEP